MSFERKVTEPKPSKCGGFVVRAVKVGNKLQGEIIAPKVKPGEKPEAIFWGRDVIKEAPREGGLLVSRAAVAGLRSYAVKRVGLKTPDGTTFTAALDDVTDATKVDMLKHKLYIVVPQELWVIERPDASTAMATLMKTMRVSSGRGGKSSMTV